MEWDKSSSSGARSNLPVSTGRPLTPTFSGQSGSVSGFRHPGSLAPRGSSMTGSPSLGVQPPRGSISGAWFPPNSLQASIYQVGYPALSNRGGMHVGGSPVFTAAPVCGNFGPRITYVASVAGGGNTGRTISSAGMSMPTVASPVNLSGSGALNIRGSNQMGGTHQQGSPVMNMLGSSSSAPGGTLSKNQLQAGSSSSGSPGMRHDGPLRQQAFGINAVQQNQEFRIHNEDFPALPRLEGMELHRKDHLPKNANTMQAQHYPMGKSSGFNTDSSCPPRKQHKQTANSVQNTGPENVGPRPVNSPRSPLNPRPREQVIQQNHEPQAQKSIRLQSSSGPESHKDNFILRYDDIEKIPALPPLLPATQNGKILPCCELMIQATDNWASGNDLTRTTHRRCRWMVVVSARAWTPSAAASSIGQALVDGLTLYARHGAALLSGLAVGATEEALLRIKMNTIKIQHQECCKPSPGDATGILLHGHHLLVRRQHILGGYLAGLHVLRHRHRLLRRRLITTRGSQIRQPPPG
uniref:Uncharacterized protein n=1 Tax=Oryza meridionalis TaxID=40149 RepID=A0A0E0DT90_9ORYZ